MSGGLKVNWHKSSNFGDQLNPYLIKKIWNLESIKINEGSSENHLMMLGSILNEANPKTLVMGAGFVSPDSFFTGNPKILSVRGNLTKKILGTRGYAENEIKIGDPAIILPDFYKPANSGTRFKIGIVPHIIDYERAEKIFSGIEDCTIIDLRLTRDCDEVEIESIIDQITSCDCVISSSLHGLIVAHAYGIPGLWCEISDGVLGDGFKFRDYFSAHTNDYKVVPKLDFKEIERIDQIDDLIRTASLCLINTNKDKHQVYEAIENITWGSNFKEIYLNEIPEEI